MINYDRLEAIKRAAQGIRNTAFLDLSERYVGGEGDNPTAMIIGEAPGAQEESQGRPFVGPAGVMLKRLMALADLYGLRTITPNCWLTNVVKFRPPYNRTPTLEEINIFRLFLLEEWWSIGCPNVIIPVGSAALRAVFGKPYSILKMAGNVHHRESRTRPGTHLNIWPMIHPSYGMRSGDKRLQELLERDWERLGAHIK